MLQTVPGVIVDRVNVGGSESGQQSRYVAKGADFGENTWHLDGIPITDMTGLGDSPTYYDFGMFQEVQVTTGGADVQTATPGAHLNFVLKEGTNRLRGSARLFFANDSLQSNNLPSGLTAVAGASGKGNRTDQYADYGFDLGGPLLSDKWWAWGSIGRVDVRLRTLDDVIDRTVLEDVAFKTTRQITPKVRAGFTYFRGEKTKSGRGAGPLNPTETTQDQSGPTSIYKGEATLVAGTNLFLTGRGAWVNSGFTIDPKGGRDRQAYQDSSGVYHQSFWYDDEQRPQRTLMIDASWFRGRHEARFGGSWRHIGAEQDFNWGGGVLNLEANRTTGLVIPVFIRPYTLRTEGTYTGLYFGDTIGWDRLTAQIALRYDRTTNSALETEVLPHPLVPEILPGFTAPAVSNAIEWNALSPRVGVSYALGANRKTVARASYSSFASQLGVQQAALASAAAYAYTYYLAIDANRDQQITRSEILFNQGAQGAVGVDLSNPTSTQSVNQIDSDLTSPRTQEIVLGLDRELPWNVALSTSFTWRHVTDALWSPLIGVTSRDYRQVGTLSGSTPQTGSYSVPYFALNAAAAPRGGGVIRSNRDGYYRRYTGLEVAATRRLAQRWMGRVGFSINREREYFDDPAVSIQDPTPTLAQPQRDGGVVVRETTGSGKSGIFMIVPSYQFLANGLWQGPWGINVAGSLLSRQGFGMPYFANDVSTPDPVKPLKDVLVVDDIDKHRLPTMTTLDLRVEKTLSFRGAQFALDADLFNVMNSATVLRRQYDVKATGTRGFDTVLEILNPRILRLGLRVSF